MNTAVIAATNWEDDSLVDTEGLYIEPGYDAWNVSNGSLVGVDTPRFYKLYNQATSYESHTAHEWVCLKGGQTAEIGRPYPGTKIQTIDLSSLTITELVSANSVPDQVSTSTISAGLIVQSNKPVSLQNQADHSVFAPLSLSSTALGWRGERYFPATLRIFCLYDNTSFSLCRDNSSNVISTHTGDYGDIITITLTESDWDDKWGFLISNYPIVGTTNGNTNGDNFVLPIPAGPNENIYRTRNEGAMGSRTLAGNSAATSATNTVRDPDGCFAIQIADGNGGDADGGIPTSRLKDTYAFGQGKLTQYSILSGYNQTVTVSYYDSGWIEYDTHTFTAASVNSPELHAEGNPGASPVVPLVDITTVWKFEGDEPFCLITNDGSADEEAQIGWNREETNIAISY